MNDLTIVVPLGISTPGTPVIQFLQWCVESLQKQETSRKYEIVFACDDNVSSEVKDLLNSTGCSISWHDPYSFFRKGSIWKKIITEWQKVDSKFVSFCHYDDLWSSNKVESQLNLMNMEGLDLSWSNVQIIDEHNKIVNVANSRGFLNETTIRKGPSYAFSHSTIVSKDKFLESGIMEYLDRSAPIYEGLHYLFCHKLKGNRDHNSTFYHRVHGSSVSNNLHTETPEISKIREIAEYSLDEVFQDEKSINIDEIIRQIYP